MIIILPDATHPVVADAFAVALDAAKGQRPVAQTGLTLFSIVEEPPLSDDEIGAIRALAERYGAAVDGKAPQSPEERIAELERKIAELEASRLRSP